MKLFEFYEGKSVPIRERSQLGKPEWPHNLTIVFSNKKRAWEVIYQLLGYVQEVDEPIESVFELMLVGKMSQNIKSYEQLLLENERLVKQVTELQNKCNEQLEARRKGSGT